MNFQGIGVDREMSYGQVRVPTHHFLHLQNLNPSAERPCQLPMIMQPITIRSAVQVLAGEVFGRFTWFD